jgi:hypothetical protein
MKLRNWVAVVIAITLVTIGNLVFAQVQNAKAADIDGAADNITGTIITVGTKTLIIDSNTKIEGQLVPGAIVQIKAKVQDDGTLLATRIQVKNKNGHKQGTNNETSDNRTWIQGTIQSVASDNSSMVINGKTILINQNTRIEGQLVVGANAMVIGVAQPDGSLLAINIAIWNSGQEHKCNVAVNTGGQIGGVIQSVASDNSSIVINGQTISINQNTRINGQLAEGVRAEVKVVKQQDGSLLALKIEIPGKVRYERGQDRITFPPTVAPPFTPNQAKWSER